MSRPARPRRARVGARELERRLDRLGAAVAEEHALVAGRLDEHLRQFDRRAGREQVRDVHQRFHLLRDRAREPGLRVTERVHRDAAHEVEVLPAVRGDHARPAARDQLEARQRIHGRHQLQLGGGERLGGGCGRSERVSHEILRGVSHR